jgi:hypothetical protein
MIKIQRRIAFIMIASLINLILASCISIEIYDPSSIKISGQAMISKNPIRNGERVYLSIDTLRFDASGNLIRENSYQIAFKNGNGNGVIMVHFFVDDIEVGSSNDKANNYVIEYTPHLREGFHKLRAEAVPQEDDITYTGSYQPTNFFVMKDNSVLK